MTANGISRKESDSSGAALLETDERYGLVKRALQHIAADHALTANGDRKRLPRHEAIRLAREACEALGWDYSSKAVVRGQ